MSKKAAKSSYHKNRSYPVGITPVLLSDMMINGSALGFNGDIAENLDLTGEA